MIIDCLVALFSTSEFILETFLFSPLSRPLPLLFCSLPCKQNLPMRHWNDLHESLAAPSPFVPTCRPRSPLLSSKQSYGSAVYCSMATAKQPYSAANSAVADDNNNNKPLHHLSGALADESHKTDEDVAAELVQYLQAAQDPSASSPSFSSSTTTSPVSEMFKAGHRRLRQLAQRQKKDADPDARAEDESRQLSALQREGLLPASAVKKSQNHRNHSKKSVDFPGQSVSNTSCKSSSRRDVERIGRPWLDDPLERCMMDPLSSSRLPPLEIGNLGSFMDAALSGDGVGAGDAKPAPRESTDSPNREKQTARQSSVGEPASDKAVSSIGNNDGKAPTSPTVNEPPAKDSNTSSDSKQESDKHTPDETSKRQDAKPESPKPSNDNTKPPKPEKHTLKLFPDPLPPRISSKHAWRLSKCPPANAPQAIASGSQQSAPPTETSKPARNSLSPTPGSSTPKEPSSAPAATQQFANAEKDKPTEDSSSEQSSKYKKADRHSSLPISAIDAFPLPAPTRPLPSLPQPAAAAGPEHGQKMASSKKTVNRTKGVPKDLQPPSNPTRTSPRPSSTEPSTGPAPVPEQTRTSEQNQRLDKVRALRMKDLSAHRLHVGPEKPKEEQRSQSAEPPATIPNSKKANRRSVEFAPQAQTNTIPESPLSSPSLTLSPIRRVHPFGPRAGGLSATSPVLPCKHSEPMLASRPRESLQIRRSNSSRRPNTRDEGAEQKPSLRSEYPIPSSDDEGIDMNSKPRANQAQKKRRRAKQYKATDPPHRVPRIEKPTPLDTMLCLSPQNDTSHSVGRSSPLSQYSQSTCHSHDSRTLSSLEGRIAQLERQNKILQAALFAALDAGNKESKESILSGTVSSLLSTSAGPSSKTTPASSLLNSSSSLDEPVSEGVCPRMEKPSNRRDAWLDTRSISSRSSMQSSNFSAHGRELEVIHDIDLDWLSERSNVGNSLKVQV